MSFSTSTDDRNRYMPGLAEGMEGVKAGEMRDIKITFPDKLGPQGGDLEGTKAIFEVEAVEIKVRSTCRLVYTPPIHARE